MKVYQQVNFINQSKRFIKTNQWMIENLLKSKSVRFYSEKKGFSPKDKKAFLQNMYFKFIQSHLTFLLVQQKNVSSKNWEYMREQLHILGASIKVLRTRLFALALQTAYNEIKDKRQDKNTSLKLNIDSLRILEKLLVGPIAVITLKDPVEPPCLKRVIDLIEKSNNQFQLLGGLFENEMADEKTLSIIKMLPDRSTLYTQLIYSLTTTSNELVQALEYSQGLLPTILNARI
ncbi:hypothetical protein PCK1_000895 [Pneumocystis canis]|nr:hypothetical protein PCK1_000895 [Pneumocystis canis]